MYLKSSIHLNLLKANEIKFIWSAFKFQPYVKDCVRFWEYRIEQIIVQPSRSSRSRGNLVKCYGRCGHDQGAVETQKMPVSQETQTQESDKLNVSL